MTPATIPNYPTSMHKKTAGRAGHGGAEERHNIPPQTPLRNDNAADIKRQWRALAKAAGPWIEVEKAKEIVALAAGKSFGEYAAQSVDNMGVCRLCKRDGFFIKRRDVVERARDYWAIYGAKEANQ